MLTLRDWFEAAVAIVVGGLLPWMVGRFKTRRDEVNAKLNEHAKLLEQHVTQLAVLHNDKANVAEVLRDIRENNQQQNEKLDAVIMKLIS